MALYVVEDDAAVRDSLVLLLRQLGYDPHAFADAEGFVASVVPDPDDTVIVDLGLPGMPGSQLIRWLQRFDETPRIIVISGQSQGNLDRWLTDIPVENLVRKPLTMDAIAPLL
ncbi:MAG: response regulator [Pseudomonadota bacterium]